MELFPEDPPPEAEASPQAAAGTAAGGVPLAERMRPRDFDEFVGQDAILGSGKPLRRLIDEDRVPSIVFWGPPGCGKTTLARLIARCTDRDFRPLSAVTSGVKDVKAAVEQARAARRAGRGTVLFIDEVHRFNKAQQDAFLPHVEDGTVTLIGATTENPSFELTAPLLSRCRVFVLEALQPEQLAGLVRRALADPERGVAGRGVSLDDGAVDALASLADGDARGALNLLDFAVASAAPGSTLSAEDVAAAAGRSTLRYDKAGEEHYNLISALHKSLRGSDAQAALYWLARMIESGEDPLYIVRRMLRFASEDVGNADPQALVLAVAARDAVHFLGLPEADTALAQLAVYLATAPKSNRAYVAMQQARRDAVRYGSEPVPLHLRNAPTDLMKDLGYGAGYQYAHDDARGWVPQDYLPDKLKGRQYYKPAPFGFEREIEKRLAHWDRLRREDAP